MSKRAAYHTTLKELVHYGLLPPKYVGEIPRSNLHRWRNDSFDRFMGSEINAIADNHTELIKTLNEYPKMFYAYGRLVKTVIDIVGTAKDYARLVRGAKERVVEAVIKARDLVPITKAVKLFGISRATFHAWVVDVKLRCSKSYFQQCNRVYSTQITPLEVEAIKRALLHPRMLHWSIRSVYWDGIRNGTLSVSLNTMYRVNRLLEIRTSTNSVVSRKKRKKGIRADGPNLIWHADITTLKTLDNKRYYVYLVIDNFSRCILSYDVRESVQGLVTTETIKEAYAKALRINPNLNVKLIVDGGPENNNIHIDGFIKKSEINIEKLVALRDINYSNSMIEAMNKILKYRYIFPEKPKDLKHLKRILRYFINDFNTQRPHGVLNGLTPLEALHGVQMPKNHKSHLLKMAKEERFRYNKENRCVRCE